ncbi:MAG: bifunctional phosphopantothenoylcysteine decarboxylase/phosphopantothenate--cysteine ligase CoaBC [Myxococcales bacterium]|nr:bifunctional phosphopantothenoylcysteine decarboxylase/phosphopantothenate--cysteine ligase CoaBC [Myxococcales bacterium]
MRALLAGRRIVVGVGASLDGWRVAELIDHLAGAEVRVVVARGADRFVTLATLEALSRNTVANDPLAVGQAGLSETSSIGAWAELLVVMPATADTLARLALGLADDALTATALATRAPLLLAPSMDAAAWGHPRTQENLARLVARGARTVGPVAAGGLAPTSSIVAACVAALSPQDLAGMAILVTAGPTHEAIDPVRFLGNRSSGKMGFAIARRAAARGARVTLIAGPVALATPDAVERIDVESAREMHHAVMAREAAAACVIKAAAVADFRPSEVSPIKLKKGAEEGMALLLTRNPDLLAELAERRRSRGAGPVLVGFAAETGDLLRHAREKLARKGCDLLVANDVTLEGAGFGFDTNRALLLGADGVAESLPLMSKLQLADTILDRVLHLVRG